MKISIYLNATDGSFHATGLFDKTETIVLKGSTIRVNIPDDKKGADVVKKTRCDRKIVDSSGIVLADCAFSSPSTAAQFVTGRISNGYVAWRVDAKNNLGRYLGREKTKGSKQHY